MAYGQPSGYRLQVLVESPPASAMVENHLSLPQDLITDILLRLPAKSIGRFKCVSKPWRSLLSSPKFVKLHLKSHLQDPENINFISSDRSPYILIFATGSGSDGVSRKVSLLTLFEQNRWTEVEGSCHGLVLLQGDNNNNCSKFLMNPITLEVMEVPKFHLSLEPFVSFCMLGLGYDSLNDDYKIVSLSYYDTDNEHEPDCEATFVDVYSAKMRTWKRVANSPYDHAVPHVSSGVYVNGCLHWLASDTRTKRGSASPVIAAFNLSREDFEEVPPPHNVDEAKFVFNQLAVLGGCLALVDDSIGGLIGVWVMREYGVQNSWTSFTIVCPEEHEFAESYKFVCVLGDDEIMMVKNGEQLVAYDCRREIWRDMVFDGFPGLLDENGVMSFRESIVSPNY